MILPLIVVVLLAVVQVGLVVRDQIGVIHAAREAARTASLSEGEAAVRQAAAGATSLAAGRMDVELSGRVVPGEFVTVRVEYRSPTDVPLVGVLVGDPVLSAETTMRVE